MKSNICQKCSRGSQSGNKRSHSNIATKRVFRANLQIKHVDGKKMKLCTTCIKTLSKA